MTMTRSAIGGPNYSTITLLAQLEEGHGEVESRLVTHLYQELRRIAGHFMRRERAGHTLQPTALVNEAYARMVEQPHIPWKSRTHFLATAAQLMRHILVDHARARCAGKRGGIQHQVTLDEALLPSSDPSVDVLALNEALENLAKFDPRQSRIIELHFFGGLSLDEIAAALQISERTVKREWSMARAWLKGELSKRS